MNSQTMIVVDESVFNVEQLNQWLTQSPEDGAIVTFTGKVRTLELETVSLYLEHYQGMTEKVLEKIVQTARERWDINRVAICHRVGEILANQSIVFVGVSSAHRNNSFAAAEYIMDVLKNEAPFWKKEKTTQGNDWVEAKESDYDALKKWQ